MMDLVPMLEELGVEEIREGGKEITARCPMHEARTGQPDTHPSWSINKTTGMHICFSCGWAGGLNVLYVDLGYTLPTDLDQQIKVDTVKGRGGRFVRASQENKGLEASNKTLKAPSNEQSEDLVSWSEQRLRVLEPVPSRMAAVRRLKEPALHTYGVLWDPRKRCWVLPIRNEFGVLEGVQLRQKGVESNQPTGVEKGHHLFGLSALVKMDWDHVTLVESPLDAVRLYGLGIPAVSSYGAWVSAQQIQLLTRHFRTVVLALDNDKVGRESTARTEKLLRDRKVLTIRMDYRGLEGKDPGDIESDYELKDAWVRSRHSGLTSKMLSTSSSSRKPFS